MARYLIDQPYYRPGSGYSNAGSIVFIPDDEAPAPGWTLVGEAPAQAELPAEPKPKGKKRASDVDVA